MKLDPKGYFMGMGRRRIVSGGIRTVCVVILLPFVFRGHPIAESRAIQAGFEENRGQFPEGQFIARSPGFTLVLEPNHAAMKLHQPQAGAPPVEIRMTFSEGSAARLAGYQQLSGVSHYLRTSDAKSWLTNVHSYARVHYEEIYPGIDLVFRRDSGEIEYDFVVAPGADPNRIKLAFGGIERADVDAHGDLVLATAGGAVRQRRPQLYQEIGGVRYEVTGDFVLQGKHEVGFRVGSYDTGRPLVIDPVLVYSTTYGGARGYQGIHDVTTDASGNAYVLGYRPWDGDKGPADLLVSKFGPNGQLHFETQFGGWFEEEAGGIALDSAGNIYVTGSTQWTFAGPPPFPTTPDAFQRANAGGLDAFFTKLDPTGKTILYSTFLGGAADDSGADIAVDASGRIYIAGQTNSADFPTAVPWQSQLAGSVDAFVTIFNPAAAGLIFSTYLGGSATDSVARLAISPAGVTIAGTTASPDFPTSTPLQAGFGGATDAFLSQLSPAGALLSSTYLGGSAGEQAFGVSVDEAGFTHVMGNTNSTDFPTVNALQPALSFPPEADAFLAKIAPNAGSIVYSTYLEVGTDAGCTGLFPRGLCGGLAVDGHGNAFVTAGSPLSRGVFITKVDSAGVTRLYTYSGFGGNAIALTPRVGRSEEHEIVVAGRTRSFLFPVLNAFDPYRNYWEFEEGWLMKATDGPNPRAAFEENDPRITYTGTWEVNESHDHSRGAALRSAEAGATADITFTGTGIQVIGRRDPSAGIATILRSFDPTPLDLDTYASSREARSLLLSISNLPKGTYTVTLQVKASHSNRSSGDWIWIDGMNILGSD